MINPYSRPLRPMHDRSLHELARMVQLPTRLPPPARDEPEPPRNPRPAYAPPTDTPQER